MLHNLKSIIQKLSKVFGIEIRRDPAVRNTKLYVNDGCSTYLPNFVADFSEVPGMVSLEEGMYLYWLAYGCGLGGDIIEIGSWQGRSTSFFAQASKDTQNGVVHAIDNFTGNEGKEKLYKIRLEDLSDLKQAFEENLRRNNLHEYVTLHNMDASTARKSLKGIKARILFIDGNHEYDYVKADLKNYLDLVISGGIIILDDYRPTCSGVVRAVKEELLKQQDYLAFVQTSSFFIARKK